MPLTKKRVHEQEIIRKKKQMMETIPKKRRTSYLSNHLLVFTINNTFRVQSRRMPMDCFICTLEYLRILDKDHADMFRALVTGRGATVDQMLAILRVILKEQYNKIESESLPFDSIYQLFELLTPSTATIVGFVSNSGVGHIVLLAKDMNGRVGIIDPQEEKMCVQEYCEEFVRPYRNNPLFIFTHA